jgi:hypothetical protein
VILKHAGDKFWDKVDEKLEHIRKTANNDKNKNTKCGSVQYCISLTADKAWFDWAMKHLLNEDRARYGTSTKYEIQEGEMDEWLDDVDAAAAKATD